MKSFSVTLSKGLKMGLRRFKESPRNSETLLECFNIAPAEEGLEPHEPLIGVDADGVAWGGGGVFEGDIFVDHEDDFFVGDDGDLFVDE